MFADFNKRLAACGPEDRKRVDELLAEAASVEKAFAGARRGGRYSGILKDAYGSQISGIHRKLEAILSNPAVLTSSGPQGASKDA